MYSESKFSLSGAVQMVLLVFLISSIITGCKFQIGKSSKDKEEKDLAVPVLFKKAELGDISSQLHLSSVLNPLRQVRVFAQSSGIVVDLNAEEGEAVQTGQVLLRLDNSDQKLALDRAEALLNRENLNLSKADALYIKEMLPEDEYQRVRLALRDAELNLRQAKLAFDRTVVRAPFDGIIAERFIEYGDRVDLARPLFSLVDQSKLQLNVWINETDLNKVKIGLKANVKVLNTDNIILANVIRISPVVDPAYGKIKATFELNNPPASLKPGQFVEVMLTLETHKNTLIVPKRSIIYEAGIPVVFVFRDSLAFRKPVHLGLQTGDFSEIAAGLLEGELVIVDGQATLRDSTLVKAASLNQ